jgi:hypothetical protein
MGYGRELMEDSAYERYAEAKAGIWTMKNGDEIEIKDMTDSHIKNCMRMVGKDTEWYEIFQRELDRRTNHARSYR